MCGQPYKLRPHHGLCLSFFQGKGYSEAFVANMTRVKAALEENRAICLTGSADIICAACPNNRSGVCTTAEKVARYDREVLERCGLAVGQILPYREFEAKVHQNILLAGQREAVCGDCQWSELCHWEAGTYDHQGKTAGAVGDQ